MDQEKFNTAIEEFIASKYKKWIALAGLLIEARENGEFVYGIEGVEKIKAHIGRLITAYRFLSVRRPELIKHPENVNVAYRGISGLPVVYSRLSSSTREKEIEELLDKVLQGKFPPYRVEVLAAKLEGKPYGNLGVKKILLEGPEYDTVKKNLSDLTIYLNGIIASFGYETLREKFATECDNIATKLLCIADPSYKKMWDERKEEKI